LIAGGATVASTERNATIATNSAKSLQAHRPSVTAMRSASDASSSRFGSPRSHTRPTAPAASMPGSRPAALTAAIPYGDTWYAYDASVRIARKSIQLPNAENPSPSHSSRLFLFMPFP
jgi:hypothetical protein